MHLLIITPINKLITFNDYFPTFINFHSKRWRTILSIHRFREWYSCFKNSAYDAANEFSVEVKQQHRF